MNGKRILIGAVLCGLAVAVIPWFLPTGPDAGLDAARFLASGQFAIGAAVVFLGGLLTSLTPCVYPLIPITVSVFGARQAESRGKSVLLTSAYVVGMGAVFSALGVVAALSGRAFGSSLGNEWLVVGLSVFLLVLASSMFGAFELALPSSWATKLNGVGGRGLLGALLMGSVSGFLAAPCTGPVLSGILAFVAKTQSAALGAGFLFIYALGIGVPFFLLGVFTIRLPKGGVWMEWVKSVLGIVLVALAVSYIKDAFAPVRGAVGHLASSLGRAPGAWIAGALTVAGILVGAVHRSFKEGPRQFALKAAGVLLVVGALTVRGGALNAGPTGALWVKLGWAQPEQRRELTWQYRFPERAPAASLASFERQLEQAKASGKPVMIDFFAEWCAACKELDRETYVAPDVVREAGRFVSIKVDATDPDDKLVGELQTRFGAGDLPTVAFISSTGTLLEDPRVKGFLAPEKFLDVLQRVR